MIRIYGIDDCKFTQEVVDKCIELDMEYEYIETLMDEEAIRLFFKNEYKTVPQIFIMGEHMGGYDEFMEYLPN
jgi:glutaredoxin